jgi:predicted ABC-type ATPase
MAQPKLRIFAGPNGSGKSTLFEAIKNVYFSTQIFINADLIESQFKKNKFIDLSEYNLDVSNDKFISFVAGHGIYSKAEFNLGLWNLQVNKNVIVEIDKQDYFEYNSYHFAIISDFLRTSLIKEKISFSFETVFSHPSKLHLINYAKENGYKVYLYFIGTNSPIINQERIDDRVKKGGHSVSRIKISDRYFRTMKLLYEMIMIVDEAYLWDNSKLEHKYVGSKIKDKINFAANVIPTWIDKYLVNKL